MIKCKLSTLFREEGMIKGSKEELTGLNIKRGSYYICFGSTVDSQYSFLIRITDIMYDESDDGIVLEADSRKVGPFRKDDAVYLIEHLVNSSDSVELAVIEDETLGIPEGDWTSYVKPELSGKVVELGDEFNLPIEFPKDGKKVVKIVRSVISGANIPLPCKITENTVCEIKKYTQESVKDITRESLKKKRTRAQKLIRDGERRYNDEITETKSKFERISENLKFHGVSGQFMNDTIEGVFSGYQLQDSKSSSEGGTFSATRLYLSRRDDGVDGVIEYHILSKEDTGSIILNVFKKDLDQSIELCNRLTLNLTGIHEALKKLDNEIQQCPECGASLPLEHLTDEKTVICQKCGLLINLDDKKSY